ncbi:hypothetical protein N7528_001395 [Penicillium herquei]|nr:hypothetical protein N7528_001395 [Penicillium herquei]
MASKTQSQKTRKTTKRSSRKRKSRDKKPDLILIDKMTQPSEEPGNQQDDVDSSIRYPKIGERIRITDDTDFASDDYDGRIKRCEERIRVGYLKPTFEKQLVRLKALKAAKEERIAREGNKDWGVIERLTALRTIADHLEKIKDPHGELPIVMAIIAAYENRELKWDGLTTYWAQGKMIAGPSPFAWSDFRKLNTQENRGNGGFWVEGIAHLNPYQKQHALRYNSTTVAPGSNGAIELDILIRLDQTLSDEVVVNTDHLGAPFPELSLKFEDDTGADVMAITKTDMEALMGNDMAISFAPMHHLMGYMVTGQADGSQRVFRTIAVQVNMMGRNNAGNQQLMLDTWTSIPTIVYDDPPPPAPPVSHRLGGPWLRCMFYVASAPEFPYHHIYAATTKSALTERGMVPIVPADEITEPDWRRPQYGAGWNYDFTARKWVPYPSEEEPPRVPPQAEDYT